MREIFRHFGADKSEFYKGFTEIRLLTVDEYGIIYAFIQR